MAEQPDRRLIEGLNTRFIGHNIFHYPTIPSTQDVAMQAARAGAFEGAVVTADEQTSGRGRLQRSWLSPKDGSLSVSVILRPSARELARLFMVAALAAARSIEKATGLQTELKWPNDVLIDKRKVCGILIENELRGSAVSWAVVGIGININLDTSEHPEIAGMATSLSAETGRRVSRSEMLKCLLEELEAVYLASRGGAPVHQEWRARLVTLGTRVRANTGDSIETGCAESVDEDGALLLRRDDGSLVRIVAGDVTLRA
ncbi:MAG: biotin--[acetyl-CoA-carboxylase] ligase [Dehalococcoidia bacterium]|nr:biotin--[acetyl-CoA-carboxylase] ligase [Dehalococcoidia bacterium]